MFIRTVGPRLRDPDAEDLVVLRVVVEGEVGGGASSVRFDPLDHADTEHGISAMMRTTGYSLAAVARLQGSGRIPPGAHTPAECVPLADYLADLAERGIDLRRRGD